MADKPAVKSAASAYFDTYEYVAVIIPGAVLLFGGMLFVPAIKTFFVPEKIDLGSFGLFLVAAFTLGHLVRALSRLLEDSWWEARGWPTDNYFKKEQTLIEATQKVRLDKAMKNYFKVIPPNAHFGIVREIYMAVRDADKVARIDTFNRTYGMFSGIAVSFFILALYVVATCVLGTNLGHPEWLAVPTNKAIIAIVFFIAGCLSVYSMDAFGKNYARELAVEFIRLRAPAAKK